MYLVVDGNHEQIIALARALSKEAGPLYDKLHSDIYDSDSLFAKTLRQILTDEQILKYDQGPSQRNPELFLKLPRRNPEK